jgi:hypothetical protein
MRIWPTKRFWKRLAIGVAIVVALALIANGFMAWWVEHKLQAKIAAIRAAGDPASIADLAPKPIPADQNAAAILKQIGPRLDEFAKDHVQFLDSTPLGQGFDRQFELGETPTPEQIEAIRAILDKYPDIDTGLAAAAACNQYASMADFSLGSQPFLEQYLSGRIRTPARFLVWRIEVLIADGQSEEAAKRGLELLRLARLYDREPLLVNMLVGIALRGMAVNALYDSLAAGSVSPDLHTAIDQELALHVDPQRMARVLKTERAYSVALTASIGLDSTFDQVNPIWMSMVGWSVKRFYMSALDYYDEEIQAVEQPWTEGHKRGVGHRQLPEAPSGQGVLVDLLIPATQAAYEANERATAVSRSLRILNALSQFLDEHRREARGLEELSLPKEATIDPFSGDPLKLMHTDDGWVIYSVMQNGVDDGGDFKDLKDYGVAPRNWRAAE